MLCPLKSPVRRVISPPPRRRLVLALSGPIRRPTPASPRPFHPTGAPAIYPAMIDTSPDPQFFDHRPHDHGKSTLADQLLETATIPNGNARISPRHHGPRARARHHHRAAVVRLPPRGQTYDSTSSIRRATSTSPTRFAQPGRVRGRHLLVDASQGVQAQTVANAYLAMENNLTSSRSSTRSTCRPPTREPCCRQIEAVSGSTPPTRARLGQGRGGRRGGARGDRGRSPAPRAMRTHR